MPVQRHPIRGLVGGLLLGLGIALLLIVFAFMPLGQWMPIGVVVGGGVLGLLIGLFGPTRAARDSTSTPRS